jgi:DNA polymerase III subunit delta'
MAQLISSVIGHHIQIENLKFAIAENKFPHALIFSGPQSIGKKKVAMALAQILICEDKNKTDKKISDACGVCGSCLRVEKNRSENLKIISPDGAAIKADQVRDILDYLSLSNFGKNRVIIFDQAHLMNPTAANMLLKTLEEPNSNVYFILLGPEVSNFMTTIKSRSQVIRFSALSTDQLQSIKPNLPNWAYSCARGQVAQLDQLTSDDGQKLREESLLILEHFWNDQEFLTSEDWKKSVKDRENARQILNMWTTMIRDVLVLKTSAQKFIMNLDQSVRLKKLFQISTLKISDFSTALLQADRDLAGNGDTVLIFESLWVKYARS